MHGQEQPVEQPTDAVSCSATYPSSDMIACATTLLIERASFGCLRLVDVHDGATREGCRFDEVQVP
jgi:hypothetical protein